MSQVFGYVVLDKVTRERCRTERTCYASKAAASAGFNLISRRAKSWNGHYKLPDELIGKKFKEQDKYVIVELVAGNVV